MYIVKLMIILSFSVKNEIKYFNINIRTIECETHKEIQISISP